VVYPLTVGLICCHLPLVSTHHAAVFAR
jgi:hypothetical protein